MRAVVLQLATLEGVRGLIEARWPPQAASAASLILTLIEARGPPQAASAASLTQCERPRRERKIVEE